MGAPKGNQYAKGNPGGRRPSAYEEHRDAAWHGDVWKNQQDKAALEARIASGKYSGRDMALKLLLEGNRHVVTKFMDKLVPDLHEVTGAGGSPLFLPTEIIQKNELHPDPGPEADSAGPA
jgi:hypothetical protein